MRWVLAFVMLVVFSCPARAIDYERFEENGKVGIRDGQGHIVVPASFDALGWSDGGFSLIGQITGYRQGKRWGLLNLKKEFITKAIYEGLTYAGGALVLVRHDHENTAPKYGCLDLTGKLVIPIIYDEIKVDNLRAIVMKKEGTRYLHGLVDFNHRVILPVTYKRITPLGTLRFAVQNFEDKIALCSDDGAWSTGFDIDSVSVFQHDLAVFHKNLHQGIIDRTGVIRADALYRQIEISGPGFIRAKMPDTWKTIDMDQRPLRSIEADDIVASGDNLNLIRLGKQFGLVDSLFQPVIPVAYDYISMVKNKIAIVGKHGAYGLIRTDQSEILPSSFDSLIRQGHLILGAQTKQGQRMWDLFDTVGVRKTSHSYQSMSAYNGKYLRVGLHGYIGALDVTGREIIACVYDDLVESNETHVVVQFRGQYGIITLDDHWVVPPTSSPLRLVNNDLYIEHQGAMQFVKDFSGRTIYFTEHPLSTKADHLSEQLPDGTLKQINFQGQVIQRMVPTVAPFLHEEKPAEHEGLIAFRKDGKYGFVDARGRLRIANRYEAVGNFHEGLARFQLLGKWGFIDKADRIVVQPSYQAASDFRNGVAQVGRNHLEGLIDANGNVLLELRYDSLKLMSDGSYLLFKNNLKGLADSRGKILIEPRFEELAPAGKGYVIVRQDDRYGLLTHDGLSVFPIQYEKLIYLPQAGHFFAVHRPVWETIEIK